MSCRVQASCFKTPLFFHTIQLNQCFYSLGFPLTRSLKVALFRSLSLCSEILSVWNKSSPVPSHFFFTSPLILDNLKTKLGCLSQKFSYLRVVGPQENDPCLGEPHSNPKQFLFFQQLWNDETYQTIHRETNNL